MLNQLPSFRHLCHQEVTLNDITVVIAVRLHEGNPWVLDRLAILWTHFNPLPPMLVVDFGSTQPFRKRLQKVSESSGFKYIYVDDTGTFCLSKARNVGASQAVTDFVFFNDIDVFGPRDFFAQLVRHANAIGAGLCLDTVINVPVYHLSEARTAHIWAAPDDRERSLRIESATAQQVIAPRAKYNYVDPSSNFFLIRRSFFDLTGGYNETFRGHGSEDFEYLLRMAYFSKQYPLPTAPLENIYGPIKEDFYGTKRYRGFRRFGEVLAYQSECAGLRLCHLYHPRGSDAWYQQHDRKKQRFAEQTAPFLKDPTQLVQYDWMARDKRAIVLLKHRRQFDYFLPLRMAGYKLELFVVETAADAASARERLASPDVDAVAVFNPYMNSHKVMRPLVELARKLKLEVMVVDRGLLPDSWFFGPDMPYADPGYGTEGAAFEPSEEQLAIADDYRQALRTGSVTLEANGDFESTVARRGSSADKRPCVLIPLQLEDDVAITHFNGGKQPYPEFLVEVHAATAARPDVRFFIKPHPLSKRAFESSSENVVVCGPEDNIHALIELSDHVVCYNSGVGFLGMLHGKAVTTVGNAFYNLDALGTRAGTFAEAIRRIPAKAKQPDDGALLRFLAWLIFEKYAFFKGDSVIREMKDRRAHHYRNLLAYQFPLASGAPKLRAHIEFPFSADSYAAGRLGTNIRDEKKKKKPGSSRAAKNGAAQAIGFGTAAGQADNLLARALLAQERRAGISEEQRSRVRKARKLVTDPRAFFRDAASNLNRKLKAKE